MKYIKKTLFFGLIFEKNEKNKNITRKARS